MGNHGIFIRRSVDLSSYNFLEISVDHFPNLIGHTVRDVISGYQGVVTQMIRFIGGNYQAGIQPKAPDDSSVLPDIIALDTHTLEVVDDKFAHLVTPPVFLQDVILGSQVEDLTSGVTGVAVKEAIHINGCVFYHIVPKLNTNATVQLGPDGHWVNQTTIRIVSDGIVGDITKVKPGTPAPGGPSTKVMARTKLK